MALIAMGAVELAPLPSPGFFTAVSSRCGCPRGLGVQSWPSPISFVFVTVSPFPMVPIQSVLLSVCQGTGWPTSFSGQRFFRCRSILLLVTCASSSETCLSIQGSLLCPFHGSTGLHLGLGSCFRLSPHSTSPREALTRRLTRPVFLSCLPRQGSSDCSLCLSRVGVCHTSPNVHPCAFTGGTVSRCAASLDIYLGFCVAGSLLLASVTSRSISVLRLASRELMALAAGSSSSLAQLVPEDRLRLRSIQLWLHRSSDRLVLEAPVSVSQGCLRDLL